MSALSRHVAFAITAGAILPSRTASASAAGSADASANATTPART